LQKIPTRADPDGAVPFWDNIWFLPPDAVSLYAMLARFKPSIYFEIGSGNSTRFARQAIIDHNLRTRIISVDPHPRAAIDSICDEVIRKPCERVSLDRFSSLPPDTVMFADNSHRSFTGSDVTVFFTEILPNLPPGIIWGLHDIFLPDDYPPEWTPRFYNEQYLLMSYLLGGGGPDRILLPVANLTSSDAVRKLWEVVFSHPMFANLPRTGACFWMRRAGP
jgi:hypothetical protein